MAGEDRDHTFEQALARNLRGNAPGAANRATSCGDAESLAAYHERLLRPEEMSIWKEHIASCSRCQEILAHVEETDSILVNLGQETAATQRRTPGTDARAAVGAVMELPSPRRRSRWLWTAPAGAVAAGLLVWVVVRSKPVVLDSKSVEVAQNRPVVVAPAPESSATQRNEFKSLPIEVPPNASALYSKRPRETAKIKPGDVAAKRGRVDAGKKALSPQASPRLTPRAGVVGTATDEMTTNNANTVLGEQEHLKDVPTQARNYSSLSTVAPGASPVPAPAPAAPVPSASETVEVTSGAQVLPTQQAPVSDGLSKTESAARKSASGHQQQHQGQVIGGAAPVQGAAGPLMRLARSRAPVTISAPDGKVTWRIGAAGTIERVDEGNLSSTVQSSGVVVDLLAGSATSDQVCWVAGRLGIILRTSDGGAHWEKVRSPVEDDVISVFAVNAEQATISSARGSYQTSDGGASWNKLASE